MNELATHYSRFRVAERLLLTGHSHQAWPDAGFAAQQQAWLDAAELVDEKWTRAAAQADEVRTGFARLLGDRPEHIALGQNTHELVTRWLSALPLRQRPHLVTSDAEFHSLRRQIDRLAEELPVTKVAARPVETLVERLGGAVRAETAAVLVSSVLFDTAEIVPGLDVLAAGCRRDGVRLLVDAYHHLNVVPFDLEGLDLEDAFVTGGGYKYCQLGEGNCFLRVPPATNLRPLLTGWFAEFEALQDAPGNRVAYGPGAAAFAGATYDPTSHYRAAAVFAFHRDHGLTPEILRATSRRQVARLAASLERFDLDPEIARIVDMPDERRAGFLAVRAPEASRVASTLRARGVLVDARGDILRLGPAPYVSDDQLDAAADAVSRELTALGSRRNPS